MQVLNLRATVCLLSTLSLCYTAQADVKLPRIFGNHMVLQREQANPVWGTADAGETVTVQIEEQSHVTVADTNGNWRVELAPLEAGGPYTLSVSGTNELNFQDVLVGEVWLCSGQSNMQWPLNDINHADVEIATANNPQIRLLTIERNGTTIPQDDIRGEWQLSSSETAADFSAVGYLFGKRLQNALDVPIGLIDNAWGGSAAEAWMPRDVLEDANKYNEYIEMWDERCANYSDELHAQKIKEYREWVAAGKPHPKQHWPKDPRVDQQRPSNLYNGMVHPLLSFGIRGVIWYQGESNVRRAYAYRELFPLLISTWRELWQQGDFSFYWVQLANRHPEVATPQNSAWAELRESQTMTLSLPNTGEAVIIDSGEGRDVHPRDKQTVADRLVRHALAKNYGFEMASDSPRYTSMQVKDQTVTLTFEHVSSGGLRAFDTEEVKGFSIAGSDQQFVWAQAKIVSKNQVEVCSDQVTEPVAVRYAWAGNPVANLQDRNGLPVTPFRTDDWRAATKGKVK
ncbi:sialate O-acetylesterase [Coraliomargarita algicola]|uniref:Sialate O-acetylesterase n=1 Tax=Coraliomargarita algicola TaxID=3092156 RepID=A0ABZ0RF76_9BACT|nr:sialate O-acetylesterase [Coraliomargarita sp. J2-16]WPJ94158.1 sialate O-acetylesterase [Coraliomargarita sp. J2-16]